MTRAGKAGEFSPCERMFVCQLKLAGHKFPSIREKFMQRFGKLSPSRSAMIAMAKKLKTKFSVWDQRKGGVDPRNCEDPRNDCFCEEIFGKICNKETRPARSISEEKSSKSEKVILQQHHKT